MPADLLSPETLAEIAERLRAAASERQPMSPLDNFLARYDMSRSFFYKLRTQNRGPRITKVGKRSFIAREDEDAWLATLPVT
jgi:hypothetical protein